jgi:pyruvate kinase
VADAAVRAAEDIRARFVVAFTQSGYTARLLSKFRPATPIVAFTHTESVRRRMSLYRGVVPEIIRPMKSTDAVFREVEKALIEKGMVGPGDGLVITASTPILGAGKTNLLKVHRVGDLERGGS